MPGRGSLIAAAVVQLSVALLLLLGAAAYPLHVALGRDTTGEGGMTLVVAVAALALVAVSVGVLCMRRWAVIGSIVADAVVVIFVIPIGTVAVLLFHLPLVVAIALNAGGRHAVSATRAKTAAEPAAATPRDE